MRRLFFTIISVGILVLLFGGFFVYRSYEKRREDRIKAVQQQKAKEVKVTLVEGWTLQDIAGYLESKGLFSAGVFTAAQKKIDVGEYDFLASKPRTQGLEGFLFPDTYQVLEITTPETVLSKLLSTFGSRFASAAEGVQQDGDRYIIPNYESVKIKANAAGLTVYQLVTLASIIEKETGRDVSKATADQRERLDEERRTVAGIFYNRLGIGKALESDATINYATGKNNPTPTIEELSVKSAYNTYANPGLPPGPICNPSLSSLNAVLHPIKTDYYYFLHKQPSGEVVYSKTFEEHVQNKFKYLK